MGEVYRAGLRVVKNTLEPDWDRDDNYLTRDLADIKGRVEIEITPDCILTAPVIEMMAEALAAQEAYDELERCIEIHSWCVMRAGSKVICAPKDYVWVDPGTGMRPPARTV